MTLTPTLAVPISANKIVPVAPPESVITTSLPEKSISSWLIIFWPALFCELSVPSRTMWSPIDVEFCVSPTNLSPVSAIIKLPCCSFFNLWPVSPAKNLVPTLCKASKTNLPSSSPTTPKNVDSKRISPESSSMSIPSNGFSPAGVSINNLSLLTLVPFNKILSPTSVSIVFLDTTSIFPPAPVSLGE